TLAFDVFLANGDVESAYRVARAAVAAVPDDAKWRGRPAPRAEAARETAEAPAPPPAGGQQGGVGEDPPGLLRLCARTGDSRVRSRGLIASCPAHRPRRCRGIGRRMGTRRSPRRSAGVAGRPMDARPRPQRPGTCR